MQKSKRTQEHKSNRISNHSGIPHVVSYIEYRITNLGIPCSVFIILYATCALTLAGCAEQQQYKAIVRKDSLREQICVPDMDRAEVMQAAEEVLSRMHFTIDKADTEKGIITTRPLAGAQWFEFWRSDNVGNFNSAEANLHSIRRFAELNISPRDLPGGKPGSGGQLCIGCNVKVQRLNLPEREISSSSEAYRMFSKSKLSMQTLKLNPEQKMGMAWVDLGKDIKLATEILNRIALILDIDN